MATDDRKDWFMNFLAEVDVSDPEDPSTTPSVGPSVRATLSPEVR